MSNNTDRHSTPAASSLSSAGGASSSLRPPRTGALASTAGHQLRASADMGALAAMSPLANRGIRPASEVYLSQFHAGASGAANPDDVAEKVAQQWIADIDQYENTLEDMAAATLDQDFKDELAAIEQWFRVLSEPERTAALYALLQQTTYVSRSSPSPPFQFLPLRAITFTSTSSSMNDSLTATPCLTHWFRKYLNLG